MKIQTKILVLLAFVVVLFLAGLFALNSTEYKTLHIFQDNLAKQSELYFDKIVSLKGESLEIFAYDYTYWDEMVTFISTKSLRWASENVDEGMKTYKCNAIWIYGPDLSPVYSVVFDPFYTTKPVGQGVGLGLSLSHGIITALGGVIEAESAPGSGTTFTIKLPAAGK